MVKPIVAQLTKAVGDYPKGAELGFDSVAKANSVLGDESYKVVSYQDGSPWEAPTKATRSSAPAAAPKAAADTVPDADAKA